MSAAGATVSAAYTLGVDASQWQLWWEFNKDPFIRLKDSVHAERMFGGLVVGPVTLAPTARQIDDEVLPALAKMLGTDQRDMVSGALIALAKVGRDHKDFRILDLMAAKLRSGDQEIRETAALAMGISQMPRAVESLAGLVRDDERGRVLTGRSEVDYRTRSFAAYGLGLIGWSAGTAVKTRCFKILAEVLGDQDLVSRDLRVAAIEAIGTLAPTADAPAERLLLEQCLQLLARYYHDPLGPGDQLIQAHAPSAIARLLGRNGPASLVNYYRGMFLNELRNGTRESHDLYRSAVLALGQLSTPEDADQAECREVLLDWYHSSQDRQARYFSLIALGQIGGDGNRQALLEVYRRANDALGKSWSAIALGVHADTSWRAAERAGRAPEVDRVVGRVLHQEILRRKNPEVVSALGIALGLCRYTDAADDVRDMLLESVHQDELAGYLCVGLGLMDDSRSKLDITDIVASSVRRPQLLRQGAVALGILGDMSVADDLQLMLVDGGQSLGKMSAVASALGLVGDRRAITPLVEVMADESLTDLTRAFAAVALGGVADKEPLPWNAKLAAHTNYRAAVETLTDGANGILDIL